METGLLLLVLIVLFIRWLVLRGRMDELKRRLEDVESSPHEARLIERIYALEKAVEELRGPRASAAPAVPEPHRSRFGARRQSSLPNLSLRPRPNRLACPNRCPRPNRSTSWWMPRFRMQLSPRPQRRR